MAFRGKTFWALWRLHKNDEISISFEGQEVFAHSLKAELFLKDVTNDEKLFFINEMKEN